MTTANVTTRILFVEDFPDDAILIARRLGQLGMLVEYDIVDTADNLIAALRTKAYDVILCDYNVPALGANASLPLIREHAPHVPAIVVSGSIGEEQAADLMRAGARDIVIKSNLARLAPAIEREVAARSEQTRLTARADQSERHFTNLVERSLQGIIIRGQFKTLFANHTLCSMFGYTPDEVDEIASMLELIHPDDHARVANHITRQLEGADPAQRFEAMGLRKDGTTFWIEAMVSNIVWFGRDAVQIVAIDITERKLAEQLLADSEQQYRETFENAPVAMAWVGLDRRFRRTNNACRDLYGYGAEDFLTMKTTDLIDAKYRQAGRLEDLIAGRSELAKFENRHRCKDGSTIWVLTNMALIRSKDGAPDFLLAHLQDITARKTAEDQLFQALKMEAVGNFAGGIAHDFNNMLVPIIGLTDFMKEEIPADSPLQENLDLVLSAASKARDLVRQILTFSRQDEMAVSEIEISPWVREALSLLRNLVPTTITIAESIQSDVGTVMADSAQLQSIVMNLGSNAVAAIGGRVGEIRIGLSRVQIESIRTPATADLVRGPYARLSVGDSGRGMDTATLTKIFDPFFTTKAPGEGTGLGLSMVHGIVERYGGAIEVTSRIGVGTRFDIYLPLFDVNKGVGQIERLEK